MTTAELIGRFGYLGIILVLILGGLGLPVPEEAPIILGAILSRKGQMSWPLALASCFVGVLVGDFIVYGLGYFQGERVLSFPITRRFLSREREAQIKGYFHRHGIRILITGRFVPGFRTAAYLTAGILRLPPLKLFLADLCAASLSTLAMFGLGYFFAHWVETKWKEAQGYVIAAVGLGIVVFLLYRHYKAQRRGGAAIGPHVSVTDEVPVPVDDLRSGFLKFSRPVEAAPEPEKPAAIVTEVIVEEIRFRPPEPSVPSTAPAPSEPGVIPPREATVHPRPEPVPVESASPPVHPTSIP